MITPFTHTHTHTDIISFCFFFWLEKKLCLLVIPWSQSFPPTGINLHKVNKWDDLAWFTEPFQQISRQALSVRWRATAWPPSCLASRPNPQARGPQALQEACVLWAGWQGVLVVPFGLEWRGAEHTERHLCCSQERLTSLMTMGV